MTLHSDDSEDSKDDVLSLSGSPTLSSLSYCVKIDIIDIIDAIDAFWAFCSLAPSSDDIADSSDIASR